MRSRRKERSPVLQGSRKPTSAWRKGIWLLAGVLGQIGGITLLCWERECYEHKRPAETAALRKRPAISIPGEQATYGKLPLFFEANHGQADPAVRFLARDRNATLFLTDTEAVLTLRQQERDRETANWGIGEPGIPITQPSAPSSQHPLVLRMRLIGAQPHVQLTGHDPLPGKSHYVLGNDPAHWHADIPTYAPVTYEEVYRGVDLVYHGNQRHLEYDFVLAPGTDPKTIRLAFAGADTVEVDARGDLLLHTTAGLLRQRKPFIHQEVDGVKQQISGSYVLHHFTTLHTHSLTPNPQPPAPEVGFQVAAYDPSKSLVIDPVLVYSTYLGGGEDDIAEAIAVDAAGNAYVTGTSFSSDFPTTTSLDTRAGVCRWGCNAAVVVVKLDANGTLVYATYLGGRDRDEGHGIAVDAAGHAYVTGETNSLDFPFVHPVQGVTVSDICVGTVCADAFVAKLDPTGSSLVYATALGGPSIDQGRSIAVDATGNAYLTGWTMGNFPTTNAVQATFGGFEDVFVAKLNATGDRFLYATYLGGPGSDRGFGIAIDPYGSAYVTGSTSLPHIGVALTERSELPSREAGAPGQAESPHFPTVNPLQSTYGGDTDAFVAKLDPAGTTLFYSTYLGGNGPDEGHGIATDLAGNAYVTGHTFSPNFPTANALQAKPGGSSLFSFFRCKKKDLPRVNAFVAALNPAGSAFLYSTYLGGEQGAAGASIAVDAAGNAYITGGAFPGFPTVRSLQRPHRKNNEVFVAKLNPHGAKLLFSTLLGGKDNEDSTGIAVDPRGNIYIAGHTYSADFPTVAAVQEMNRGTRDAFVVKIALQPSVAELIIGPALLLIVISGAVGAWWWARGIGKQTGT